MTNCASASLVQAGRLAEAQFVISGLKAQCPDLGFGQIALLPFAKPGDRDQFSRDLRSAGLDA